MTYEWGCADETPCAVEGVRTARQATSRRAVRRRPRRLGRRRNTGSAAETLRRRAVAEDQPGDRRIPLGALERLGPEPRSALADRHGAGRIRLEVQGPVGVGFAGCDEQRPVRLLDEPDGRAGGRARHPTARLDDRDHPPAGELLADVARRSREWLQRLRCQDLPSVWTDGA